MSEKGGSVGGLLLLASVITAISWRVSSHCCHCSSHCKRTWRCIVWRMVIRVASVDWLTGLGSKFDVGCTACVRVSFTVFK